MFDEDESNMKGAKGALLEMRDLEPLSLEELRHYITLLKGEIERSEAEIKRKEAHMEAASSVFK